MLATADDILTWLFAGAPPPPAAAAWVTLRQPAVERAVKDFLDYDPEYGPHTDYWPPADTDGPGEDLVEGYEEIGGVVVATNRQVSPAMRVRHLPLRAVTAIYENPAAWTTGVDWPAASLLAATAYQVDWDEPGWCRSGLIRRRYGGWYGGARTVRIDYVSGYTAAELASLTPIRDAVLQTMLKEYNQHQMHQAGQPGGLPPGAVVSFSVDGVSKSLDAASQGRLYGQAVTLPPQVMRDLEPYRAYRVFG